MPFQPAPRVTEAGTRPSVSYFWMRSSNITHVSFTDHANDRKSLERKLDQSLYLIVKRNREDNAWQFPQGKVLINESLRQVMFSVWLV